ncbi:MarR family winged helix-turn-helix transcriptional regulator [Streptacidiphilus sp. MAP12-16]|uniref:MarR family winged helix-turn-helix transcriptional regulator n=1 Tax=Streptacidiphilus sp. MAP12-16 TaxID=3156300 RepID=UPI0035133730
MTGAPLRLSQSPGQLIRIAQQVHTRLWSEHVGHELTAPQYAALVALAVEPGADQRTVGERASLDKATMAEMVGRLVRRGLVLRRRDPADGRRKLLTLSPLGTQVVGDVSPGVARVQQQLLEPLTEPQRCELMTSLSRMARMEDMALETMVEARPILDAPRVVGYLIRVAQQVHTRLWTEHASGELTAPQHAVLAALAEEPGIDQRTVGERASLDKATMAELVSRLVRRGLVLRRRDPADGRRNLLALSPAGTQLLDQVRAGVAEVQNQLLAPLDPTERERVVELLSVVARLSEGQPAAAE